MGLSMDLAALCDMRRWNGPNGSHLAVFNENVAFAYYFMAPHAPQPPKQQAIQLAIQCTADTVN